jgi:hypothetical protein
MTAGFWGKDEIGKAEIRKSGFQLSQFLLFRQTAAPFRARPLIIRYSIYLVVFAVPSRPAPLFSPIFTIFDENQSK